MDITFKISEEQNSKEDLELFYKKKLPWSFAEASTTALLDVENSQISFFSGETIFGIVGPWKIDILENEIESSEEIVFETQTPKMHQIFSAPSNIITLDMEQNLVRSKSEYSTLEFIISLGDEYMLSDINNTRETFNSFNANQNALVDLSLSENGRLFTIFKSIKSAAGADTPITQITSDYLISLIPSTLIFHESLESLRAGGDTITVNKSFYINQFMLNILTALSNVSGGARLINTEDGKLIIYSGEGSSIKAQFASNYDMQDSYEIPEAMPTPEEVKECEPSEEDNTTIESTFVDLMYSLKTVKSISTSLKIKTAKYHIGTGEGLALKAKKDVIMDDVVIAAPIGQIDVGLEELTYTPYSISITEGLCGLCANGDDNSSLEIIVDDNDYSFVKIRKSGDENIVCLLAKDFS